METNTKSTPEFAPVTAPTHLHAQKHIDPHSKTDSVMFAIKVSVLCSLPFGFLMGLDRAPGSFYAYGISCFIWPMVAAIVIGVVLGSALGSVFAAITHASDPDAVKAAIAAPAESTPEPPKSLGLRLHLRGR